MVLPPYLIDVWTGAHVLFFAGLTLLLPRRWLGSSRRAQLTRCLLVALFLGLLWEVGETRLEHLWTPYGEPWWNRWCSDPLADVLGGLVGFWLRKSLRRTSVRGST